MFKMNLGEIMEKDVMETIMDILLHLEKGDKRKLKQQAIDLAKKQAISYATGHIVTPVAVDLLVKRGIEREKAERLVDIGSKFI